MINEHPYVTERDQGRGDVWAEEGASWPKVCLCINYKLVCFCVRNWNRDNRFQTKKLIFDFKIVCFPFDMNFMLSFLFAVLYLLLLLFLSPLVIASLAVFPFAFKLLVSNELGNNNPRSLFSYISMICSITQLCCNWGTLIKSYLWLTVMSSFTIEPRPHLIFIHLYDSLDKSASEWKEWKKQHWISESSLNLICL